ncbi:MAG TPA: hypothetical protein VK735_39995 [Pseudonocardia sp.]|uniref:hypothetical protein n=1 Tax=Pseudonocardia sp. TaxID=60912 RepID=UPI002BFB6281|nr:hypothetical protein [Pseudonocardia sp.]HTF53667.1 hypothetical protein [Pseudonocardia sp.]
MPFTRKQQTRIDALSKARDHLARCHEVSATELIGVATWILDGEIRPAIDGGCRLGHGWIAMGALDGTKEDPLPSEFVEQVTGRPLDDWQRELVDHNRLEREEPAFSQPPEVDLDPEADDTQEGNN